MFFLILCISNTTYSQNSNSIWCFGDSAGIDFTDIANPFPFSTGIDTRGSCVSIADSTGHLLFYAETRAGIAINSARVYNKNHQIMDNGDSLVGEGWYNELMIIPFPDDKDKYYLFTSEVLSPFGLYYSVIDITYNSGLGRVIQKNIQIDNLNTWDAMAGVRHANGRDWWLITKDYSNGGSLGNKLFHVRCISPTGITDTLQSIGEMEFGALGNMSFSKDGNKFLFTSYNGLVEVMDFDRCTGLLSNPVVIENDPGTPRYWGSAFSPNGSLLYLSKSDIVSGLYQYDLTASNVHLSRDTIATLTYPLVAGGALRLAPDNKIYWTCAWTNQINFIYPYQDTMYHTENMNLSVINDPDIVGSGCNFSLYSFNLGGKRTYWGLPNNPDYTLGPVIGSVCDTLSIGVSETINEGAELKVFYHPGFNVAYLNAKNIAGKKFDMMMYDINGRELHRQSGIVESSYITESIDCSNLRVGIYIIKLVTQGGVISGRFAKVK